MKPARAQTDCRDPLEIFPDDETGTIQAVRIPHPPGRFIRCLSFAQSLIRGRARRNRSVRIDADGSTWLCTPEFAQFYQPGCATSPHQVPRGLRVFFFHE